MDDMNMGQMSIKTRFYSALVISIVLFVIDILIKDTCLMTDYINFFLSTIVVFGLGSIFFYNTFLGLKNGNLNMFALVLLAVLSAWGYSAYQLLYLYQSGSYFLTATYVSTIVLWGHYIEMNARMQFMMQKTKPNKLINTVNILQNKIDKIAGLFVLFVIIVALLSFGIWAEYVPTHQALSVFIAVLLAACPCALTLASPISLMVAEEKINNGISEAEITNKVHDNINQNITIGVIYNLVMIPLAAGILYPYFGVLISPVLASFMMSLSSIIIIMNSLKLRRDI